MNSREWEVENHTCSSGTIASLNFSEKKTTYEEW